MFFIRIIYCTNRSDGTFRLSNRLLSEKSSMSSASRSVSMVDSIKLAAAADDEGAVVQSRGPCWDTLLANGRSDCTNGTKTWQSWQGDYDGHCLAFALGLGLASWPKASEATFLLKMLSCLQVRHQCHVHFRCACTKSSNSVSKACTATASGSS